MVRSFLDAVVAQLPSEGMAEPPRYHLDDDEARIRASRRAWADGVLEAVLGMPMSQFAAHSGQPTQGPSVGGLGTPPGTRDGASETEGTLIFLRWFLMMLRLKLLQKLQVWHLWIQVTNLNRVM